MPDVWVLLIFFFSDLVNNDPDSSPQSKSAFLQRFIRRLRSDDLDTDLNLRTLVPRDYNSGKKIFNKDVIIMHNVTYRHGALYLKGEGTGSSPKKNFGRKSTSFLYVYHLDTVSLVSCFSVLFFNFRPIWRNFREEGLWDQSAIPRTMPYDEHALLLLPKLTSLWRHPWPFNVAVIPYRKPLDKDLT